VGDDEQPPQVALSETVDDLIDTNSAAIAVNASRRKLPTGLSAVVLLCSRRSPLILRDRKNGSTAPHVPHRQHRRQRSVSMTTWGTSHCQVLCALPAISAPCRICPEEYMVANRSARDDGS
jgi:hypothetical protein